MPNMEYAPFGRVIRTNIDERESSSSENTVCTFFEKLNGDACDIKSRCVTVKPAKKTYQRLTK